MKLSTRTRYGLRAIVNIARNGEGPVSSEAIADCESISKKYLDGILGRLRDAGLIQSFRGQGGGYSLARHPGEITVLEIVDALEGGVCFAKCVDEPGECGNSGECAARALWDVLADSVSQAMRGITVERLASWEPGDVIGEP